MEAKEPKHLTIARDELTRGVHEIAGPGSNPEIDKYHGATSAGSPPRDGDATPWCSSFACWCMEQAGIRSTRRKSARSWIEWGYEISRPVLGCVVVMWRGSPDSGSGHVGYFMGYDARGWLLILGGNQGNSVSVRAYAPSRVVSYRWHESLKAA